MQIRNSINSIICGFTKKDYGHWYIACFIGALALVYRLYGLQLNTPFWVDEFSTARNAQVLYNSGFVRLISEHIYMEYHTILLYILVAFSYALFGISEMSTRLPVILLGACIPPLTFLLGRRIFNSTTGLVAALGLTFSYFHITYSRQARSYILIEFFVLLSLLLYFRIIQSNKVKKLDIALLLCTLGLGMLSHSMYFIFLIALFIHGIYHFRKRVTPRVLMGLATIILGGCIYTSFTGIAQQIIEHINAGSFGAQNVWYYHAYLWKHYSLVSFISIIGFAIAFKTHRHSALLPTIYVMLHLIFILFIFKPYVSRYILPIWPLIFLFFGYGVTYSTSAIMQSLKISSRFLATSVAVSLILFIVLNGNTFTIKPRLFYSVNHDFREIALIDYNEIYDIIINKGRIRHGEKPAIIETWGDRVYWYLGYEYEPTYMFKWFNADDSSQGLSKKQSFATRPDGERYIPDSKYGYIGQVSDLQRAMKKYPKGFIFIDDASLPEDVIVYAEKNLHKELYLDHYTLDDNPYSIWPATLYSWGIEE